MKELLIVRSVSFQQLDLNLPAIKKQFPDYQINLLTHEHGLELAKKYNDIHDIYVYHYPGSFDKKNKVPELQGKVFDGLIIPVTNITGSSFLNVLSFGVSIKSKSYYMCNVVSEISKISHSKVIWKRIAGGIFKMVASLLSIPCIILTFPFLLIKLGKSKSI